MLDLESIEQQAREALALSEAATPGPWRFEGWNSGASNTQGYGLMLADSVPVSERLTWGIHIEEHDHYEEGSQARKDAAFVAEARTLLPQLARAVLERGEVLRAVEWCANDRGWPCCPVCGGRYQVDGHAPDCALAKALGGGDHVGS